jgi:hypothetical protein
MATFMMLRRRGIPATLIAGVEVLDGSLAAHAWVNSADAASKDDLENSEFTVVLRIGQRSFVSLS